jgi:hypothetical protein
MGLIKCPSKDHKMSTQITELDLNHKTFYQFDRNGQNPITSSETHKTSSHIKDLEF